MWRAHLARSRCWALVGPFHSVRAPPRVRPRSRAPFGLLWGGRPGPVSAYLASGCALPVGWVRAWGPVTNPTARALASRLCALWGRHEGSRGGRLLPGCGASGVGRSPTPNHSSFWACGRGPLPTGCGCGGCGHGDPSPTPQRALLRAGFARSGGSMRVPGGEASCLGVGCPGLGGLPPPTTRPFGRAGGAHYPLAVGAGVAGVGTRHRPHSARFCMLALRAVGAAQACPGGAPLAWVWGVRGRALSHPRPLVRSGVRPGPTTHWLWVRGVRAWGPVTKPTARALASWLCALWGQHEDARGGRLLPGCGASGEGRSPTPYLWSVRACGRGPLPTGCACGGCRRGDPSPTPKRALASWLCALWGQHEDARGGRLLAGCGASGVGRSRNPDHSSFRACGRCPLSTGYGCRGCGHGGPSPTPKRALLRAGFVRCGGGMRAPGGGASCRGVGRTGTGAIPPPTSRPFGRAARAHYPLAVGRGVAGVGTRHQPPSALLRAGFARCGGGMRVPGGGASCLGVGRPGTGGLQPPTSRPFVRAARSTTHWLWVRGVRAWGPVTNPTARALASWLCALWGRLEGAREGRLLP